jgi:hypothetical protein
MDGSITGVGDGREHHRSWGRMGALPELGTEGSGVNTRVGESSVAGLDDKGRGTAGRRAAVVEKDRPGGWGTEGRRRRGRENL